MEKHFFSSCLFTLALSAAPVYAAQLESEEPDHSELHCVVMPSAIVDVASGVSGRVETVDVERGDTVQAGQVVAALESRVEQANLALARARAEFDTNINLRKARLSFEKRKLVRTDRLRNNRVVSVHEQDEAETDARMAEWQLRKAIDDKYLASLELARAEEVLNRRSVQSPIAGVVVERFKSPGEYVEEEPILRVARLDPLWVEVIAPVVVHGDMRKNMLAEVVAETEGGNAREARVIVIDPMGDAASGTFRVRLELPNPDLSMLGGVKCKARFPKPARYAPEIQEKAVLDDEPEAIELSPASGSDTPEPRQAVIEDGSSEPALVQHVPEQKASGGYVVLTPKLSSQSERHSLTERLRASGIRDFKFLLSGPYSGRISLGVYRVKRLADRRKSQLSALGFDSNVMSYDPVVSRTVVVKSNRTPG